MLVVPPVFLSLSSPSFLFTGDSSNISQVFWVLKNEKRILHAELVGSSAGCTCTCTAPVHALGFNPRSLPAGRKLREQ